MNKFAVILLCLPILTSCAQSNNKEYLYCDALDTSYESLFNTLITYKQLNETQYQPNFRYSQPIESKFQDNILSAVYIDFQGDDEVFTASHFISIASI